MRLKIYHPAIALLFIVTCFIAGCHKDHSQKTKTQLLTAGPWKFTQAGIDTNNDGKIDTAIREDLLPECVFDNTYTFKADSSAILDEGANNCNSGNPQQTPFNWYFMNNETQFFMSIRILPVYEETSKIIELTHKRFVISRQIGIHGIPSPLTFVIVLTR